MTWQVFNRIAVFVRLKLRADHIGNRVVKMCDLAGYVARQGERVLMLSTIDLLDPGLHVVINLEKF